MNNSNPFLPHPVSPTATYNSRIVMAAQMVAAEVTGKDSVHTEVAVAEAA